MRAPLLTLVACAIAAVPAAARAPRLTDEQRLQKSLEGLVPGKPVNCIRQGPTVQSDTYDGAIVYRDAGTRYLNRFGGDCRLRPSFDTLVVTIHGGLLCRGDIARIVESTAHFDRGSCVFDDFTPYTKPKK